jgi:AraC-like DNA-binding protein
VTAVYKPSAGHRALVENASAFGLTQSQIAAQLKMDEKTLRKHFRGELDSGKFKIDMVAGGAIAAAMKSKDERVRLDAAKYYTARRMGWKETTTQETVGKDGGLVQTQDVTARELLASRIAGIAARNEEIGSSEVDATGPE